MRKNVAGTQTWNIIKNRLQHSWFQVKFDFFFKISNSNNLFEDFQAMSLTHNKSLITCNSHNDKLIWKCIHLPKFCLEQNLVELFFHIFIFFRLELFRFIKRPKFFFLSLKELFIISITSVPFSSDWLANFWRWATLIGSFDLNINI